MKNMKRKYLISLVIDLVALSMISVLLYQLSLNLLADGSVKNLVYVIVSSAIVGSILIDILFEAVLYRSVKRVAHIYQQIDEQ